MGRLERASLILKLIPILSIAFLVSCQGASSLESGDSDPSVHFLAVGDVMVHARQLGTAWEEECQCYNFHKTFLPVKSMIEGADLAIGNLETTLPGEKVGYTGYPEFGSPDSLVTALKDSGFDLVTTSNNHSVDKGARGIRRTIQVVDESGLLHLGTYDSMERYNRDRILMVERKGIRFAFLSYTYGTNGIAVPRGMVVNLIKKETIQEDIKLARARGADSIVVLYHFGGEYLRLPDDFQREMVDFAFQKGAQIVLGGHPHVLQPYRIFRASDETGATKDRLVIYSLGNFVSNQRRRFTDGGMIFEFRVERDSDEIRITQVDHTPVWVHAVFEGPGKGHYILPLENGGIAPAAAGTYPPLQPRDKAMLDVFVKDTTDHLSPSREGVRAFLASEKP